MQLPSPQRQAQFSSSGYECGLQTRVLSRRRDDEDIGAYEVLVQVPVDMLVGLYCS